MYRNLPLHDRAAVGYLTEKKGKQGAAEDSRVCSLPSVTVLTMAPTARILLIGGAILLATACGSADTTHFPNVSTLNPDNAKEDGERLIALSEGLHRLDRNQAPKRAVVIVHGWGSRGLEWVYPIVTLSGPEVATYFFRWDWNGCPGPAADALRTALASLPSTAAGLTSVTVLGHSYGGLVTHDLMSRGDTVADLPLTAHTIASPLSGINALTGACSYEPSAALTNFNQWRTRHELDGAFKDMPVDPQVVTIDGSKVTLLPDTYRQRRLGHNWSISWVADELAKVR